MPVLMRRSVNRGGSAVTRGRGAARGRGANASTRSGATCGTAATCGKKKRTDPPPVKDEEEEEEELKEEEEEEIIIPDSPIPKKKTKVEREKEIAENKRLAKLQEEEMCKFEIEFAESRKQDSVNPSIRITTISHNAWPSSQVVLDLNDANWKPWSQTLCDVLQATPPLSLHLEEKPTPPNVGMQPNAFRNWQLNDGVIIAQIKLHISPSERDFIDSQKYRNA
jgi:hypothetical protein